MKRYLTLIMVLAFVVQTCFCQTTEEERFEKACNYYEAMEYEKALPILKELADKNHAKALNLLGVFYYYGHCVPKNMEKAVELYVKSANYGWRSAQRNLGICYQYGDGVEKDLDKAISYYIQAANNSDQIAMVKLGWLYRSDEYQESHYDMDYNYKQAEKWFRMAAKENYVDGIYGLAWLYLDFYHGKPIDERINKSAPLFEKAAKMGNGYAQIAVGYSEMREKKYSSAIEWFVFAKKNDCKESCFNLSIDTWITVCKFFIENPQYTFYWDMDCCDLSHCIYEENDYIYVGVTLNDNFGFLKLSKTGKNLGNTPFIYDGNKTFPYYDKETKQFHVTLKKDGEEYGHEIVIDITGKEISNN